jgi:two-component system, chemotaxis family, sensor histidine kinase and response regulator PixL
MLTSRSNDKHRWLAMHLGATAYFTKPYIEQTFLRAIQDIISNQQSVIQNY